MYTLVWTRSPGNRRSIATTTGAKAAGAGARADLNAAFMEESDRVKAAVSDAKGWCDPGGVRGGVAAHFADRRLLYLAPLPLGFGFSSGPFASRSPSRRT